MRVVVTGASGFIGSALQKKLEHDGHHVLPLSLRPDAIPNVTADVAYHLAHDHDPGNAIVLSEWYCRLEAAWRSSIKRQIYVSSYSARMDAKSSYGRTKYEIERHFLDHGHSIIRPGLVLGYGGTFGSMLKLLKFSPVIPVPGGNNNRVPYISLSGLCDIMAKFPEKECNAFSPDLIGLQELLMSTAKKMALRRVFVPFPESPVLAALRAIELTGIRLPVTSENLLGIQANQVGVHSSTTKRETLDHALRDI